MGYMIKETCERLLDLESLVRRQAANLPQDTYVLALRSPCPELGNASACGWNMIKYLI